jgi:WD40 repeat protein
VIASAGRDRTVRLWDASTGEQVGLPLTGHTDRVFAVALGRVGERDLVISAGRDRTVRLWDASTGEQVGEPLTGHNGPVLAVAVGRVGGRHVVASASDDRTVRLWDVETRIVIDTLDTLDRVTALALAPPFALYIASGPAICCFTSAAGAAPLEPAPEVCQSPDRHCVDMRPSPDHLGQDGVACRDDG